MAGELLKKVKELRKLVIERSNKSFKRNAVEVLTANALDENAQYPLMAVDGVVEEPQEEKCEDSCCVTDNSIDYENYKLEIKQFITEAIADEEKAIAFYLEKARECNNRSEYELAELFKELAGDEMVHSASLRATLDIYGLSNMNKELEGRREAFQILAKNVFEGFEQNLEEVEKEADKVRKEFDFAREYSKNKAQYDKEKVAGVINDLIAGKKDFETAITYIIKDCKKVEKAPKKGSKEIKKSDKE